MLGLALALAVLIGVSLGLLGSGGSIVTLPVLVYVAGIPAHQAVGMSLAIVGGTSAIPVRDHLDSKRLMAAGRKRRCWGRFRQYHEAASMVWG